MPRILLPLQRVVVSGPSMVPHLFPGDVVLVWRGARIRPDDIVLARFDDLPELLVIKRAVGIHAAGWTLASDNTAAGGDSRTHGPAEVLGRAVLVWSRRSRRFQRP